MRVVLTGTVSCSVVDLALRVSVSKVTASNGIWIEIGLGTVPCTV